jgi:hypothetical protein
MIPVLDTGTSRAGSQSAPQYGVYLEKAALHCQILQLQVWNAVTRER